jgi:pectinesterase
MTIQVTPADNLQAVFDAAPAFAQIHLAPGTYRQKVMITTPGLTIVGSGAGETVLVWDDHAKKPHPIGWEYNTFRTYTLAVCADSVTIRNLTVANDALHPEVKGQEVALSVVGTGFRMENCVLTSTQDTLFVGPLPSDLIGRYEGFLADELRGGYPMEQIFVDCLIEGTVDFIFGCGQALFEDCEIRSLNDARNIGYVAAPSHGLRQQEGIRFHRCRFTREEGVADGSIYLARPWRDYGIAEFHDCSYEAHIAVEGFDKWSGTNRNETARFREYPLRDGRVCWANREEKEAR